MYLLADTTYNSLSVDEVAASHVDAECVIHYGRASLTPLSRIPAYYVFPKECLRVDVLVSKLMEFNFFKYSDDIKPIVIFLDQIYHDSIETVQNAMNKVYEARVDEGKLQAQIIFAMLDHKASSEPVAAKIGVNYDLKGDLEFMGEECRVRNNDAEQEEAVDGSIRAKSSRQDLHTFHVAGYSWPRRIAREESNGDNDSVLSSSVGCGSDGNTLEQYNYVWIGDLNSPAFRQLQLTINKACWMAYDPSSNVTQDGLSPELTRVLRRRYYLVEKTRDANVVGILVGTLGAAGYGQVVANIRQAAHAACKKTYTLLMGKPSPSKLANFPEIEVFVLVADPQGQILESKDYLSPIVTPHEAMIAFREGSVWDEKNYSLDFSTPLISGKEVKTDQRNDKEALEARFSLVDGSYHNGIPPSGPVLQEEYGEGQLNSQSTQSIVAYAKEALHLTDVSQNHSHALQPKSAGEFLVYKRTWKGVDTPLVGAEMKEAAKAVEGQKGRAAAYCHEKN